MHVERSVFKQQALPCEIWGADGIDWRIHLLGRGPLRNLVEIHQSFHRVYCLHFQEDGRIMFLPEVDRCHEVARSNFLRNCDKFSTECMTSHPRTLHSSGRLTACKQRETQRPRLPHSLSLVCLLMTPFKCTLCRTQLLRLSRGGNCALWSENGNIAATLS
jgi:hypothetical protein